MKSLRIGTLGFAIKSNRVAPRVRWEVFSVHVRLITAVPFAVSAVMFLLWGQYARRSSFSAWHVAISTALGGLLFAAALDLSSRYEVMAAFILWGGWRLYPHASFWQLPPRYLNNAAAAPGIGLVNIIGTLAGILGPYATGWLHSLTGPDRVPMLGVAALMCVSATTVVFADRANRAAARQQPRPGAVLLEPGRALTLRLAHAG
ncbi:MULTISPECIES: hypothetical protein [Paraburkholderia]|uniref:MFS transporter n=1 Tax=Paraburkholderia podalyriae TaxID=1938811 RepID=A0ABR7PW03_9BURK|nr:hypothetical protein [Paraburkholderia podalyriae]MBC8750467.1 MFS transporter [Paraburkholderia podalyriae]